MKNFIAAWVGFILISGLLSCSTMPSTSLNEIADDSSKTAFLLGYELQGSSDSRGTGQCSVALVHMDSHVSYSVSLPADKKMIQFEAPEGNYKVQSLSCEHDAHWDLDNLGAKSIAAYSGKMNFLGQFTFRFSFHEKTHELSMVRGNREETRKALSLLARHKTSFWRQRLASAYDGKGWDPKYLEDEQFYRRGATSHVVGKKVQLNQMDFTACEKEEFSKNPAPLGILSYKLNYTNGRLEKIQRVADHQTFTAAYVDCVENTLKKFDPGVSGTVNYDVNL